MPSSCANTNQATGRGTCRRPPGSQLESEGAALPQQAVRDQGSGPAQASDAFRMNNALAMNPHLGLLRRHNGDG